MALDNLAIEGLTNAHSRRSFLKKMGIMGGGVMAMGVIGEGMLLGVAAAQTAGSDIDTVKFAYTLELVAVDAYKTAAGSGLLSKDVVAVGTKFAGQHQDHAMALKAVLDNSKTALPTLPAKINYPAFKDQTDILNFALALESAAVGAYYTASGGFQNRDLAAAAASIVGVESTHVAILRSALKMDALPTAFVVGTKFEDVQKTANSLLAAPAGGQGGAAPASSGGAATPAGAPASGVGGSAKTDDLLGAGLGVMGVLATAAAATLAFSRRKQPVVAEEAGSGEDAA